MPIGGATQEAWFRAVNHLARATPWLHGPARLFAEYGVGLFAVLLLLSWWSARQEGDPRRVAAALWAPVGALVALGLNQLLVAAFAEPRPFTVVPDALVLVARSTDPSFPSDHSVMAGAVAAGVLLAQGRRRVLTGVTLGLAVLMAATRVYVGAHFPLDVLAGLLVGAAIALASYRLVRPLAVRLVEAVGRTPGRVLVRG
ncbi:phosphatase PAP2 family protein [Pimelobacter simplex]|uniref:Phosphoesterase, PA-phosphatase related n=1 Tax=Nocardioides simplex TaxID=2045 RepID=A0A0A1DG71_NOCSI|nr:phosphatase PAP2 family protein [Pimelobacter simplex]AIY16304.1 Phosphoesterase, PA-phosphatase related [Pimelobacter simplex]MCG8153064.1 phosphatase PAP2 family protein [Pimelobacter simplex]GEB12028.1 undecaprenyl-diphosphatase [Pimelobacter simplex]SFN04698.1 undecaprenyl-diphosphatase/undecaprenyl-diphosphatase [Pimelobacter simplex]